MIKFALPPAIEFDQTLTATTCQSSGGILVPMGWNNAQRMAANFGEIDPLKTVVCAEQVW
jgi:hypothetical protein